MQAGLIRKSCHFLRWYLSRFRRLAEKTDAGRVLLPSAARAVDSVLNGGSSGGGESTSTAGVWSATERVLDGAAQYFMNPDSEFPSRKHTDGGVLHSC